MESFVTERSEKTTKSGAKTVESNESMPCPICSDGVNVRFMDPVLMRNGTRKWVCSECGLERFEYHKENSPTEFR
jgi:hypothetical protein